MLLQSLSGRNRIIRTAIIWYSRELQVGLSFSRWNFKIQLESGHRFRRKADTFFWCVKELSSQAFDYELERSSFVKFGLGATGFVALFFRMDSPSSSSR